MSYLQGVTTNAYEAAVVRELTADLYVARADYANALSTLQPVVQQNILPGAEQREAELTLGKLLRPGGVLITANLNHGGTADQVAKALFDGKSWRSALVDDDGETAISVKL